MPQKILPNPAWFPLSLLERVSWYANFDAKAQFEGLLYGLSQENLDQIADDGDMMQFLGSSFPLLDAYEKAWTAFRNGIMTLPVGSPIFAIPDVPALGTLPTVVPTGIFQRIIEYRDIVRASLLYTPEVGQAWGIEPVAAQPISPSEVKPTIKPFEAEHNYHFSLVVSGRGDAVMWDVYVLRKGGNWTKHGSYQGKSADITITPTTAGDAEQIQVYVQLRKANEDYGQPSDPVYVTVNP
ncbi:MAG: hypothetical protein IPK01_17775 [Acidobacteria bacterium]|nr:hypothetical protein [Acidobacteriota bacterium]